MPEPKAATGGADAHREEDADNGNQDMATIPEDATRGSGTVDAGGDGNGDEGGDSGSLNPSSLLGNRKVVLGIVALGVVIVALMYFQQRGAKVRRQSSGGSGNENSSSGGEQDGRSEMPNIQAPDEDPLQADHEAFQWVFGDQRREAGYEEGN